MGIKKLNRDIIRLSKLWSNVSTNKKLVLDAMSILYFIWGDKSMDIHRILYNIDQFKKSVEDFLLELTRRGFSIELVLFDGATEPLKLLETVSRQHKRIESINSILQFIDMNTNSDIFPKEISSVLHPLLELYLMEQLREMRIPYRISLREADSDVAKSAKEIGAIAVSNDSDYYMFDIPEGYMPLFFLKDNIPKIYKRERLLKIFDLQVEDLPKIAKFMGDDYNKEIIPLNEWDRFEKCIKMIKNDVIIDEEEICTIVDINNLKEIKDVLTDEQYERFLKGTYDYKLVDIKVGMPFISPMTFEDTRQMSSWIITRPIRQELYGIINIRMIVV